MSIEGGNSMLQGPWQPCRPLPLRCRPCSSIYEPSEIHTKPVQGFVSLGCPNCRSNIIMRRVEVMQVGGSRKELLEILLRGILRLPDSSDKHRKRTLCGEEKIHVNHVTAATTDFAQPRKRKNMEHPTRFLELLWVSRLRTHTRSVFSPLSLPL